MSLCWGQREGDAWPGEASRELQLVARLAGPCRYQWGPVTPCPTKRAATLQRSPEKVAVTRQSPEAALASWGQGGRPLARHRHGHSTAQVSTTARGLGLNAGNCRSRAKQGRCLMRSPRAVPQQAAAGRRAWGWDLAVAARPSCSFRSSQLLWVSSRAASQCWHQDRSWGGSHGQAMVSIGVILVSKHSKGHAYRSLDTQPPLNFRENRLT